MDSNPQDEEVFDITKLNLMTVPIRGNVTAWKYAQHTALMDHMQMQIDAQRAISEAKTLQMNAIVKSDLGQMTQATEALSAAMAQFNYLDEQLSHESLYTSTIAGEA